jgi:hypothetical protein
MKLKELVAIRTGTSELNETSGHEVRFIKMRNVDHEARNLNWMQVEVTLDGNRPLKYLAPQEILLVSKGERNTAILVTDLAFPAVASNHFFILTIQDHFTNQIDPSFLTWYLNFPARDYLTANSTGAVISVLRKDTLGNLEIPLPHLHVQKWVLDIYNSMIEQKRTFDELFSDRIKLLYHQISKTK